MINIHEVIIRFLKEEKDCTLITNEVTRVHVFKVAKMEGINIVNPQGKKVVESTESGLVHHIEY